MISSYRLIITKSYPKVSYLWVTFSFFTAQQLDSIRTTAVVRFKVLTILKTGIISSGNYSYIFRLLLLYFPAATPISFNHISYIFQWLLILVTIVRSDDICDTSDTCDTCFLKLSSRGRAGKIFLKSFPPAYVREFLRKPCHQCHLSFLSKLLNSLKQVI